MANQVSNITSVIPYYGDGVDIDLIISQEFNRILSELNFNNSFISRVRKLTLISIVFKCFENNLWMILVTSVGQ